MFFGILVECMLNYRKRVVAWDLYPKGYDCHIKWLMNKLASHPLVKITDEGIKTNISLTGFLSQWFRIKSAINDMFYVNEMT